MDSKPTEISSSKMFGGFNKRYKHFNPTLGCSMTFSIYFPSSPSPSHKFPVLYWLSGLTCTDENFIIKSGAQRAASSEGVALIAPDTSPRGLNVEGESDSWDFGVGAGFYLNAKQEKWKNWRMYDYVVKELPVLLGENFPQLDTSRASISGHSMGGHGALTIYLKNLKKYKSVSAFAPIANPTNCPWGQKAFANFLGENKADWEEYDATTLVSKFNDVSATILIDQDFQGHIKDGLDLVVFLHKIKELKTLKLPNPIHLWHIRHGLRGLRSALSWKEFSRDVDIVYLGEDDKFLHDQLLPNKFEEACRKASVPLLLRLQPGYDHSYNFIATFIDDHIRHHAQALNL